MTSTQSRSKPIGKQSPIHLIMSLPISSLTTSFWMKSLFLGVGLHQNKSQTSPLVLDQVFELNDKIPKITFVFVLAQVYLPRINRPTRFEFFVLQQQGLLRTSVIFCSKGCRFGGCLLSPKSISGANRYIEWLKVRRKRRLQPRKEIMRSECFLQSTWCV